MFSLILKTLENNFTTSEDAKLLKEFLEAFSKLNRFSIILLFADKNDQQGKDNFFYLLNSNNIFEKTNNVLIISALVNIFKFLEQEQVPDIENLYNTYILKEQFV